MQFSIVTNNHPM